MASTLSPTAPAPSAHPHRAASGISAIVSAHPAHPRQNRRSRRPRGDAAGASPEPTSRSPQTKPAPSSTTTARPTCAKAGAATGPHRLGGYTDGAGRARDLLAVPRRDGCALVVDRDTLTLGDRRLVACIAPDEPPESTAVVCAMYLGDPRKGCRRVQAEDLRGVSDAHRELAGLCGTDGGDTCSVELTRRARDGVIYTYCLELADTDMKKLEGRGEPGEPGAQLRWCRRIGGADRRSSTPVSLREVVGETESYEPVCEITRRGCDAHRDDPNIDSAMLLGQLTRLRESPIVLNRRLREAVLQAGARRGLSMGEIALRCGRVRGARRGARAGEASWLARRVGILPESGTQSGTPWVHSDVLGLIARNGLGMSPREVEVL